MLVGLGSSSFRFPGSTRAQLRSYGFQRVLPRFWIRAPAHDGKFDDLDRQGMEQLCQVADICGATGVRIIAPITETKKVHKPWASPARRFES